MGEDGERGKMLRTVRYPEDAMYALECIPKRVDVITSACMTSLPFRLSSFHNGQRYSDEDLCFVVWTDESTVVCYFSIRRVV